MGLRYRRSQCVDECKVMRVSVCVQQLFSIPVSLPAGSSDNEVRMYNVHVSEEDGDDAVPPASTSGADGAAPPSLRATNLLVAMGSVRRVASERVVVLRYDASGSLLACQSAGKRLEIFRWDDV